MTKNQKLIVVLGPTASGKSALAVHLAKTFNGEVVSADSRQVYRGLDIGSGKITKKEMQGVPHHLLDVADPKRRFTVAQFQKLAIRKIKEVQKRNNIPFLVGGTGLYIRSVVDGIAIPDVKPNQKLRKQLGEKPIKELFLLLKKLDPSRAMSIDAHNPRRLIRAVEIVKTTGKPVPPLKTIASFDVLQVGIRKTPEQLKRAIHMRLVGRLENGKMITEVKKLHRNGLSFKRLEELGLEYRFVAQYLQNTVTYHMMINCIQRESEQFAKRQMTWFKRDKRIHWISTQKEAEKLVKNFLH